MRDVERIKRNLQIRRHKVKSHVTSDKRIQSLTGRHTSCAMTHLECQLAVRHCVHHTQQLSIDTDDSDTEIHSLSTSDDDNENTATVAQSDIQSQAPVVMPSNCDVCLFNSGDPSFQTQNAII